MNAFPKAWRRPSLTKARLQRLLDVSAAVLLWCQLKEGRLVPLWASANLSEVTGWRSGEIVGDPGWWEDGLHPEDRTRVLDAVSRLTATEEEVQEYRFRHKDGSYRWIRDAMRCLDAEGAGLAEVVRSWSDITEAKHTECRLRQLSQVVEQSPCMILITDTEGVIEYVNPKFTEITGYASGEAVGRTPAMLRSGTTPAWTHEALWEALAAGREWRGEILNRTKNGDFYWCYETISPLRDGQGRITHFLAAEEDITNRRRMEARLRESQKMEALGQLTSGVAHDFNNLLTVIMGNVELLTERLEPDDELARMARMARTSTEHAIELTQKLLAFSRREPLRPQTLRLNRLVLDMVRMLRRALGESIAVATAIPEGLWRTRADPGQVENALLNLAINARDAMPSGGSITVETGNLHLDKREAAALRDAAAGDYVMLAVTDTGTGMPPEVAARAAEPFFTTKDVGEGTGLGLSMVYGFAKQSGGFMRIHSAPGRGTRVEIFLPRVDAGPGDAKVGEDRYPRAAPDRPAHILVLEEDPDVRSLAVAMLRSLGYETFETATGREALSVLEGEMPVDLLFTDITMPEGPSGRDFSREARRRRPGLKVLFTTGLGEADADAIGGMETGTGFVSKPYGKAELAAAVWALLKDAAAV